MAIFGNGHAFFFSFQIKGFGMRIMKFISFLKVDSSSPNLHLYEISEFGCKVIFIPVQLIADDQMLLLCPRRRLVIWT